MSDRKGHVWELERRCGIWKNDDSMLGSGEKNPKYGLRGL